MLQRKQQRPGFSKGKKVHSLETMARTAHGAKHLFGVTFSREDESLLARLLH